MALAAGTRLGAYEITGELGAGGMGEVYRATDTNLKRDVAIKILPSTFAEDADRLARFQREAEVLASLNHPNIAQIYGLEPSDGTTALVMELIDGPTLADRIADGPIPIDEALEIATQIADGLEAAHGRGIVHRDLKPANIKLRRDGLVKVLDFGIAKALEERAGTTGPRAPSLTRTSMTRAGIVLGTAAYMSPEQARGKPVDQRADIWAYGCILYEMLTGQPAFAGEDDTSTLARILEREANTAALPAALSSAVRHTIELCLRKDVRERVRDIGDVKLALKGAFDPGPRRVGGAAAMSRLSGLLTIGLVPAGALVAVLVWALTRSGAPPPVERWSIVLPESAPLEFVGEASAGIGRRALDVSGDGRTIVYVGASGETTRLFVRPADAETVRPLPGTEGAWAPFLSPDGRSVAFFVDDQLLRMDLDARAPTVVAEVGDAQEGSWSDDGRIAVGYNDGTKLLIVDVASGSKEVLPFKAYDPTWIAGSDWLLAECVSNPWHLCAFSPETRKLVFLSRSGAPSQKESPDSIIGSDPTPVGKDLLLYTTPGNVVMAVGFDARALKTSGPHVEVLRGVRREGILDAQVQMAVSPEGKLVFARGKDANVTQLVWVGHNGSERPTAFRPAPYGPFALSPDRKRVVIQATSSAGAPELRVLDLERGTERVWSGPWTPQNTWTWDPDSRHFYATFVDDKVRIARVDANALTGGDVLYEGEGDDVGVVESVFPDGRLAVNWLAKKYLSLVTEKELAAAKGPTPPLFPKERGAQLFPTVSPKGDWLAYTSAASGRYEIVARRYPKMDRRTQISFDGGELPRWAPDGSGLYYRDGRRLYWVARQDSQDQPFADPVLFTTGNYTNVAGPELAVSAKGDELLALKDPGAGTTRELEVVTHWLTEVRERLRRGN